MATSHWSLKVLSKQTASCFLLGCEFVGTKLNVEEHDKTCKHKNSAESPKCQALHSVVIRLLVSVALLISELRTFPRHRCSVTYYW